MVNIIDTSLINVGLNAVNNAYLYTSSHHTQKRRYEENVDNVAIDLAPITNTCIAFWILDSSKSYQMTALRSLDPAILDTIQGSFQQFTM